MLTDYIKPDRDFIVCPNQHVVYGGGFTALVKEPTVFQVPDFGDRFWIYPLYDTRAPLSREAMLQRDFHSKVTSTLLAMQLNISGNYTVDR
jgi:hypothetical protein